MTNIMKIQFGILEKNPIERSTALLLMPLKLKWARIFFCQISSICDGISHDTERVISKAQGVPQ